MLLLLPTLLCGHKVFHWLVSLSWWSSSFIPANEKLISGLDPQFVLYVLSIDEGTKLLVIGKLLLLVLVGGWMDGQEEKRKFFNLSHFNSNHIISANKYWHIDGGWVRTMDTVHYSQQWLIKETLLLTRFPREPEIDPSKNVIEKLLCTTMESSSGNKVPLFSIEITDLVPSLFSSVSLCPLSFLGHTSPPGRGELLQWSRCILSFRKGAG